MLHTRTSAPQGKRCARLINGKKMCVCVCVLVLILIFLGSLLGLWLVQELLWNHLPLLDEAPLVPGPPVGVHLAQVVPDLLAEPPVALLLPVPLEAGAPVARELVDLLRLGRRGGRRLLDGPPPPRGRGPWRRQGPAAGALAGRTRGG